MTHEQRLIVPLTDIRAVQWACRCGATMTIPIDQTLRMPTACPGCRDPFSVSAAGEQTLTEFLQALKAALRVMQDQGSNAPARPALIYNPTPDCIVRLIRAMTSSSAP